MKIGLVRRGFSPTGGAEAYLSRFAGAAMAGGHQCVLFTTNEWPKEKWAQQLIPLRGGNPRAFADALEAAHPSEHCDFLFSFERVWRCDAYRAGDGLHASWLERRAQFEPLWRPYFRRFSRKHSALLALEKKIFEQGGAGVVIANSQMVRNEIVTRFGYPADKIHVVYNGVPAPVSQPDARAAVRSECGLKHSDYVLLFAGSGWERKGLRFAIDAINRAGRVNPTLLVAGRGNPRSMPRSDRVRFLGARSDVQRLFAAADAFLLPTFYDPFSNACLEALANGLPVITTRHNGFSEIIVHERDGHVLDDPADSETTARAIEHWAPAENRESFRARLRELGAQFSMETNLRQTLAIVKE